MSNKAHHMQDFQPVLELLRLKSSAQLENAFVELDEKNKGIKFETFLNFLNSKISLNVSETDARQLFYQIDRYSHDKITLKKLLNYIEDYENHRTVPDDGPFIPTPSVYSGMRCQDIIIEWMLYPELKDFHDNIAGHFISLSRSGQLIIWTKDMKKRYESNTETMDDVGKMSSWATALAIFPKEKLLAVSTTAGDVRFFFCSTYKFQHKFSVICLQAILLCLHCQDSSRLSCGDFEGSVYIIHFGSSFFARIRRRAAHLGPEYITFESIRKGRAQGLSFEGTAKKHLRPVQKVVYFPKLSAVVSCATSTRRAMLIHYTEHNESLSFSSGGGIISLTYCKKLNCLITGGVDNAIKIWNPTVNTLHTDSLSGHTYPVNHVLVNEKELLLMSADQEKNVRVWDLLHPNCLQLLKLKSSSIPGRQSFGASFFDFDTGNLILTTHHISVLEQRPNVIRHKTHPDSELIVFAGYVAIFDSIVTVGNASSVAVWNCKSGLLVYEFRKAHEVQDSDGFPYCYNITAAGLDPSKRRLITADRIGNIKVWNYHLGLCLKEFKVKGIILALNFFGFHIYAAGSSGQVIYMYDNGEDDVEATEWDVRHERDVVSVDCYGRLLLASASCDGKIVLYLRKNAETKFALKDLDENDTKEEVDKEYLAKSVIDQRRRCSISQILFLRNRRMDKFVGNLVSCGSDGRIRFWNIVCTSKVNEGHLTSKFRAVFRECDGVLCLATDKDNHFLVSGDTLGFIRVYDLDNYYSSYGSVSKGKQKATSSQESRFPFLRLKRKIEERFPTFSKYPADGGAEIGHAPFLLNCFRAHLGPIIHVDYDVENDALITAGREGSVRLWTLSGTYVGSLGPRDEDWGLRKAKERPANMPPDVKAVASPYSLWAMNSGVAPHWHRAFEAIKRCRLPNQPEGPSEQPFQWRSKEDIEIAEIIPKDSNLGKELSKRMPRYKGMRHCKEKYDENNLYF